MVVEVDRKIRLPPLPSLEDLLPKLPDLLEEVRKTLPKPLNDAVKWFEKADNSVRELTRLPSVEAEMPIGKVRFPPTSPLPSIKKPVYEEKHLRALANAIGVDASEFIENFMPPPFNEVLPDIVEDTHTRRVRELLTPDEYSEYVKQDSVSPSSFIGMLRMIVRKGREK